MRSCIYCGRELKDGEQCTCPGAVARRRAKAAAGSTSGESTGASHEQYGSADSSRAADSSAQYSQQQSSSYQTGYTHRDNPIKNAWEKSRQKAHARKSARRSSGSYSSSGFWRELWRLMVRLVKSPVDTVSNPGYISKGTALMLSAIAGGIINVCIYFIITGAVRSPFGIALSLLTLNPVRSYSNLLYILLNLLSGAVSGILIFFIYAGIFWLINRFIFRLRTPFWDFAPRMSLTPIPLVLASIIGILLGTLSSTTLAILVICGMIGMVVLTYEALRTEWISLSPGKVMYSMLLGCFVFTAVICYIFRLSLMA